MGNRTMQLKKNPTLKDFQRYMEAIVKEREFGEETISQLFMLFLEECGEMAKAARKREGIATDPVSEKFNMEHEVADVFIYLLEICNKFGVDLEHAFREKEKINGKRTWK